MTGIIDESAQKALQEAAERHSPREAVGIMIAHRLFELPNLAEGIDEFRVEKASIVSLFERDDVNWLMQQHGLTYDDVVLWHSHPSGGVGPSTTDLRSKTPFKYHLVVSLVNGEAVFTWY